jgi:error-prone DNA polymerase
MPHGKTVRVAGLVLVRQKPPTAKGVTFCTLEDEDGTIDLILHREVYVEFKEVFMMNSFLIATGRLQRSGNSRSLLVKNVQAIDWTPKHQGIVSAMQREATNYFQW